MQIESLSRPLAQQSSFASNALAFCYAFIMRCPSVVKYRKAVFVGIVSVHIHFIHRLVAPCLSLPLSVFAVALLVAAKRCCA